MEQKPEPSPKSTARAPAPFRDRWYLRVQGRTLGPLEAEEVQFGLETGEFLPSDKIANSRNPSWQLVSEHPAFARFVITDDAPRSKMLVSPPSPQLLRLKPVALPVPPPLPVVEKATAERKKKNSKPKRLSGVELEHFPVFSPLALRDLPDAPALKITPKKVEEQKLDPKTCAALDQATEELESFLKNLRKAKPAVDAIVAPAGKMEPPAPKLESAVLIPPRPSYEPVFIGKPEPVLDRKKKAEGRVIQIELKLPEKPWRWLAVLAAIAIAALLAFDGSFKKLKPVGFGLEENKTRDLKDSRLPDPSSPTNTPLEAGDPVPPLKAPTRPQRE